MQGLKVRAGEILDYKTTSLMVEPIAVTALSDKRLGELHS